MKNGIQSLTYSVAEPKTYLAVKMEDGCFPLRFCITMAERNQIPGILPVSQEFEDGHAVLYHDITGKRRLTDIARDMGEDAFLKVLGDLCQDLQGLPDYFLRSAHCLLDVSQTYVDRYGEAFLPLVPMADDAEDSAPLLREFFMGLLGTCIPAGGAPSPRLSPLLGYMFQPSFRLEEFAELFASKKPAAPPVQAPVQAPVPPAAPPVVSTPPAAPPVTPPKPPVATPPVKTPDPAPVGGGGIKIPGMDGVVPPAPPVKPDKKSKKEAKKEAKKESKKGGGFGLFGKKPAEDKVDMEKQALMISDKLPIPPGPPRADQPYVNMPPATPPAGGGYPPAGGSYPPPAGGSYPPAGGGYPPAGGGGQGQPWTGTIQLDTAGTTALFDQGGTPTAVLIHAGKRIVLSTFPFSLGRLSCNYTINNPKVSRSHATITQQGGFFFIQDENSANHTYVNGTMLPPYTPVPLEAGCEIRLGNEYFQFQLEGM